MNAWQIAYLLAGVQVTAIVFAIGIWPLGGLLTPEEGSVVVQRWRRLMPAAITFCFAGLAASFICSLIYICGPWYVRVFIEPLCYPAGLSLAVLLIALAYRYGMADKFETPAPAGPGTDSANPAANA